MMKPEDPITVVKFKGLHHVDTTDTDADNFVTPKTGRPYLEMKLIYYTELFY